MSYSYVKDPDAVLDYVFNWSSWLQDGDTIDTYTVDADAGLTVDSDSNTTTAVTAWLSGGTAGQSYGVTCHVVTAGGRKDDRTIRIIVLEQ